jgi:hypothetical protein
VALTDPGRVDALWAQFVLLARNGALFAVFVLGARHLAAPATARRRRQRRAAGGDALVPARLAAPATMGRGSPAA